MTRRRRRNRGVSLIEATTATFVLATLLASAAWIGPTQARAVVRSHEQSVATHAAASRIERMRAALPPFGTRTAALDDVRPADLPGARATETVTDAGDGLVRVVVEVTWDAAGSGRGAVRLATLLAAPLAAEDRR